ncbi:MAG: GntR family transcriptional regulator [Natronohydrobacter sp.]|nr:GntR family transcriptional regulator [Natronohydrobacter sp.]
MTQAALHQSPGKLYLNLAAILRGRLQGGDWAPGDRLPTITELGQIYGVAAVTVRQAIAILEEEGYLRRQQGLGTFVTEKAAQPTRFAVGLDWPALIDMITKTTPRLLHKEAVTDLPRHAPDDGMPAPAYHYLRRVNALEGRDCLITDAYIDARLYARAPERFDRETIIPLIEGMGDVTIARCRQVLTIGQANLEDAALLGVPVNTPMGCIRRILTAPNGTILYFNDVAYRGDLVRFQIDLVPER